MSNIYTKEQFAFLKENINKFGYEICAEKIGKKSVSVVGFLNRKGISVSKKCYATKDEIENLKFKDNRKFLIIDFRKSENPKELAYFLGYFWADGYLCRNGIRLEITEEDGDDIKNILMKIADFHIYRRRREGRKPQILFWYQDKEIFELLKSLGKYPRSTESHEKIFNYIPEEYHVWFIRGLIDGDGCFYNNNRAGKKSVQFSISNSIGYDWSFLIEKLKQYNLNMKISLRETKNGNSSFLRCSSPINIKLFINILYKENDDIWLKRKHDKAFKILTN